MNEAIAARAARGESPETIAAALGVPEQARTIRRRVDELRGKAPAVSQAFPPVVPGRVSAPTPPGQPPTLADEVPEEPPADTPIEKVDYWLKVCEDSLVQAREAKNLPAIGSLAQKAASLMALRHRFMPPPRSDPNEDPDLVAVAQKGRERLEMLAHGFFRESGLAGS